MTGLTPRDEFPTKTRVKPKTAASNLSLYPFKQNLKKFTIFCRPPQHHGAGLLAGVGGGGAVPSYAPPGRAFFTPPLPPEYRNPFADKPTLRGECILYHQTKNPFFLVTGWKSSYMSSTLVEEGSIRLLLTSTISCPLAHLYLELREHLSYL